MFLLRGFISFVCKFDKKTANFSNNAKESELNTTLQSNIMLSDKFYWHGYIDFYEMFFQNREFQNIAEIGINKGASIRWLLERFPNAQVYGADILPLQPEWPTDTRFTPIRLDQGDAGQVKSFFELADFDLIIEDGSHVPEHQIIALLEGLKSLKEGGIYILEDVHTSHPTSVKRSRRFLKRILPPEGNALSALLGIAHYKRSSVPIDYSKAQLIASNSLLTPEQIILLDKNITSVSLYKRTRLPDFCTDCGSKDYNFSYYRCLCGKKLFRDYDSMSFVITK